MGATENVNMLFLLVKSPQMPRWVALSINAKLHANTPFSTVHIALSTAMQYLAQACSTMGGGEIGNHHTTQAA